MKKTIALFLMLVMVCTTGMAAASAETEVTCVETNLCYSELNKKSNTIYGRTDCEPGYALYDAYGYAITEPVFDNLMALGRGFQFAMGNEINNTGYINDMGEEVIPAGYRDIDYYSEHWLVGVAVKEATSDNFDYQTYGTNQNYYLIDHADVYFRGTMIGTLDRSQYSTRTIAYGDYLHLYDRDGNPHYYDREFTEHSMEISSTYGEYDWKYRSGEYHYTHVGSGQQAFVSGCTLTAEEVCEPVREINGKLIDLQGNVIADLPYSWVGSFENGYAVVESEEGLCGLINDRGEEVAACRYEQIDYSGPADGYLSVVKDGKQGYVSLTDGSEVGFLYPGETVNVQGLFASVQAPDGTYRILTAKAGVLPEHYQDYNFAYSNECPLAVVQNMDGACGVIGLWGETVIPFSEKYESTFDLDVSDDGTIVLDSNGTIYQVDYDFDLPAGNSASGFEASSESNAPASAGWTCPTCGNDNAEDSNYCPKDGTRKPETEWTCPVCGNVNPAGHNFCPKDGTGKT